MKRIYVVVGALVLAPAVTRVMACSEPPGHPVDAGRGDVIGKDSAKDGPGFADVDAGPRPCGVPGYLLDDAYDPSCGFCYASEKKYLPPPIAWQPCDPQAEPKGMVCQQMVEDWDPGEFAPDPISPGIRAWVQPNGAVTFVLGRFQGALVYRIVADADGPVRQAVVETSRSCTLGQYAIEAGKVAYEVSDSEAKGKLSSYGGGSLGGAMDDLRPRVYTHYHDMGVRSYYAASLGLLENSVAGSEVKQYDWTTGAYVRTIDSAAQNGHYAIAHVRPVGDAVFTEAYIGLTYNKLRVWTLDAGARDLVSFGNDSSQGANSIGSDGLDLVWQHGSGGFDGGWFAKNDVMAAPFTTDPLALNPRRLRSDGVEVHPFVVGCGHAMHSTSFAQGGVGLLLVRLSDGRSWPLTTPTTALWIWTQPLALTCTELFALVQTKQSLSMGHFTVVRVRLDSLGPCLPPD